MTHEHFCYNRRSAATTGLRPAGSPLGPSPYCMSTARGLRPPRAGLATRLSDFATNRHELCGLGAGTEAGGVEVGARPPAAGSLHRAGCEDGRAPRRQDPQRYPLLGLRKQSKEARHGLRGARLNHGGFLSARVSYDKTMKSETMDSLVYYEPLDTARGKLRPEAKFGGAERGRTAASQFCRLLP
jgi:hypothetical protein